MNTSLVNGYAVLDGYGLAAATLLGTDFGTDDSVADVVAIPRNRRFLTVDAGYAPALVSVLHRPARHGLATAA